MEAVRIQPNGKVKNGHRNVTPPSIAVAQGSFMSSGSPKGEAERRNYRYSVYDAGGALKDDPDVDVE
jgi:hypothetical protein